MVLAEGADVLDRFLLLQHHTVQEFFHMLAQREQYINLELGYQLKAN